MNDAVYGSFRRGVKTPTHSGASVTLSIATTPHATRMLGSSSSQCHEPSAMLDIGNYKAARFLIEGGLTADTPESESLRDELPADKALNQGTSITFPTPYGDVQAVVSQTRSNGTKSITTREIANGTASAKFEAKLCTQRTDAYASESVLREVAQVHFHEPNLSTKYLCNLYVEHFFSEKSSLRKNQLQNAVGNNFTSFAIVGRSGTGKTSGITQISAFVASLWKSKKAKTEDIPIFVHINLTDIIPQDADLGIIEHINALNGNLQQIFNTCKSSAPYLLIFDGMSDVFAKNPAAQLEHAGETPEGFYHPFVKNFLIHAIDAFLDEERRSSSSDKRAVTFVFREKTEVPERLSGLHKIQNCIDFDVQAPTCDAVALRTFCNTTGIDVELWLNSISGESFTSRCEKCTKFASSQHFQSLYMLFRFQGRTENQKPSKIDVIKDSIMHCSESATCTLLGKHSIQTMPCCWLHRIREQTKGWSLSEIMNLARFFSSDGSWSPRKTLAYIQSYRSLSMRQVAGLQHLDSPDFGARKDEHGRNVDFYDESGAWAALERVLFRPLERALSGWPAEMPRGVLIHGPSGSGKTTLLSAIEQRFTGTKRNFDFLSCSNKAQHTEGHQVNILRIDAASIISKFVGQSEMNLAALFARARALQPCIILADHIEQIIGVRRDANETGNHEERLLTTFLTEMSGLYTDPASPEMLLFIGATHFPLATIDPAALRAGRFDIHLSLACEMDSVAVIRVLHRCLAKTPHCLSEAVLKALADHLVARTLAQKGVIADAIQLVRSMAWKALARDAPAVEDHDAISSMGQSSKEATFLTIAP